MRAFVGVLNKLQNARCNDKDIYICLMHADVSVRMNKPNSQL